MSIENADLSSSSSRQERDVMPLLTELENINSGRTL